MTRRRVVRLLVAAGLVSLGIGVVLNVRRGGSLDPSADLHAQEPGRPEFHITARRYEYAPSRIEVTQDDLVKVTLLSGDIPHSFTIDEYRIAKRVGAGQAVTFEFRADQAGTFTIYCNLRQDEKCREMRAVLIVKPR